jgi:hypothetical protein
MYTVRIVYNLKGNIMKSLFLIVASVFALNAFAADAPKAPATPASTPAKVEAKKDEKKHTKSEPAKKDAPKASAEAAKSATPAAK